MTSRFFPVSATWVAAAVAVLTLGIASTVTTPAFAQDAKAPAKKDAAPAKKNAAAAKQEQNPWVKLCLEEPSIEKDEKGEMKQVKRKACYTMTERLDINTGLILSAIKVRQVEGGKNALILTVPLGMALSPGVRMLVYTGDQWKKAIKKEKVDEKKLKEVRMKYLSCDVQGCDAGVEATKELIDSLKSNAGVNILALNTQGRIFSSPMPLKGFTAALGGKPVDNKKYANARRQLMVQIQKRRQEKIRARQAKKELEKEGKAIDKRREENKKK